MRDDVRQGIDGIEDRLRDSAGFVDQNKWAQHMNSLPPPATCAGVIHQQISRTKRRSRALASVC
jgi:hypothetical protein